MTAPVARRRATLLSVVVPAYNESESLPVLIARLDAVLRGMGPHEILVVDDGSTDGTLALLRELSGTRPQLRWISLSRNFGHQNALRAGLAEARGECVVSLDADLQHPPELIPELVDRWSQGADIVYTVRSDLNTPWIKRITAGWYYRLLATLSDHPPERGTADFRFLDRRVVNVVNDLAESALFLRGVMPWVGFTQSLVNYQPPDRYAGESKYTPLKMLRLALHGVTATSIRPLFLASMVGFFVSLFAIAFAVYAAYIRLVQGTAISGWASVIIFVGMLGGAQLLMIGILGAYLGQVLREVQRRPPYVIKEQSQSPPRDG